MKTKIKNTIKLNSYSIIADKIENSIEYGYNRAFKHTDAPDKETIKENILNAIMSDLCEIIDFGL